MSGLTELGAGAANDLDRMLQGRLARYADRPAADRIDGDVPEAGAWRGDSGRKFVECPAVVRVSATIFEAAKVRIAHQANVAGMGALDDDDVIFVEVLTLVNEFHGGSEGRFC